MSEIVYEQLLLTREELIAERDSLASHLDDAFKWQRKLEAERDAARAWAQAWKGAAKRLREQLQTSRVRHLRAITKENPQAATIAYSGLMLMAAFANDQRADESLEECAFRVVAQRDEQRNRADILAEENVGFVEEAEKYARLVARIITALGKQWREETDDDAEPIALNAIAELQAERDAALRVVEAAHGMFVQKPLAGFDGTFSLTNHPHASEWILEYMTLKRALEAWERTQAKEKRE